MWARIQDTLAAKVRRIDLKDLGLVLIDDEGVLRLYGHKSSYFRAIVAKTSRAETARQKELYTMLEKIATEAFRASEDPEDETKNAVTIQIGERDVTFCVRTEARCDETKMLEEEELVKISSATFERFWHSQSQSINVEYLLEMLDSYKEGSLATHIKQWMAMRRFITGVGEEEIPLPAKISGYVHALQTVEGQMLRTAIKQFLGEQHIPEMKERTEIRDLLSRLVDSQVGETEEHVEEGTITITFSAEIWKKIKNFNF